MILEDTILRFRSYFASLFNKFKREQTFNRFESLGYNCEFGFVLKKNGNKISSFFRWAFILDYKKVCDLISNDFENVFLFKNLTPSVDSRTSIIDNYYNISFHVTIHNKIINNRAYFIDSEDVIFQKYKKELQKINYLKNKFMNNLVNKNMIYVIKSNIATPGADIINLSKIINKKSNGKSCVLYVTITQNRENLYKLKKYIGNIYIGYIDRFAPNSNADESNYAGWSKLLKNAEKIIK